MSDMLSLEDYRALADEMTLPQASHIDGSYHKGHGPELISTNPATGEALATFAMANKDDVDLPCAKHVMPLIKGSGQSCTLQSAKMF